MLLSSWMAHALDLMSILGIRTWQVGFFEGRWVVGVRLIGYLEGVFCFFMEVVNSQIAGTFKRCAECMMSNIGSHQKRITFLGTNPYPTPSEGTALSRWVFPFPLSVLWKNKSQQQRTWTRQVPWKPKCTHLNVNQCPAYRMNGPIWPLPGLFLCWLLMLGLLKKNMGRGGKMWGRCGEKGVFFWTDALCFFFGFWLLHL